MRWNRVVSWSGRQGEIQRADEASVLKSMGSPARVVHRVRRGDDDVEVAPVGVHDTELVNLGVDVMAADQELVTGHGAASGDDENLWHIPPRGALSGAGRPVEVGRVPG